MKTIKINSKGTEVRVLQEKLNLVVDGVFGKLTEEAVKQYQRENGLIVDGVVGESTWSKLGIYSTKINTRVINEIIVHCSATPEGRNFTVSDIRKWHIQRGFSDIGYHWVIYRDGSIHAGRLENKIGAHCLNHNAHSIGVCYVGGMTMDGRSPKDTRTPEQKEALIKLLKDLKKRYPKATIHGHKEFAAKACPCFDAKTEYSSI